MPTSNERKMLSSNEALKELKSYRQFSDLGVEIALSHRHVKKRCLFQVKRIQQTTASERHLHLLKILSNQLPDGLSDLCIS